MLSGCTADHDSLHGLIVISMQHLHPWCLADDYQAQFCMKMVHMRVKLPRRKHWLPAAKCTLHRSDAGHFRQSPVFSCLMRRQLCRSRIMESVASPPDTQQQQSAALGKANTSERTVHSRLHAIVMQHLRHQHKAACLRSAAPISTLPPMSLLRPKSLPQVSHHDPALRAALHTVHTCTESWLRDSHSNVSFARALNSTMLFTAASFGSCKSTVFS